MPGPLDALRQLLMAQISPNELPRLPPAPEVGIADPIQGLKQINLGPMSSLSNEPEFWLDEAMGANRLGNMQGRSIRPDRPRDLGGIQSWDMNYMDVPDNMDIYMDDMDRLDKEEAAGLDPYMKYQRLGRKR